MSFFTRLFIKIHTLVYEKTAGWIGANLMGVPILMLYVKGRRSGKAYTIPLAYHRENDEYLIVASNNALPRHPGWYFNVLADDDVRIRVGRTLMKVTVREVTGDEREQLWRRAIQTNPAWDGYRERTERLIPLIALRPHIS